MWNNYDYAAEMIIGDIELKAACRLYLFLKVRNNFPHTGKTLTVILYRMDV
jgi:hypothetical protein